MDDDLIELRWLSAKDLSGSFECRASTQGQSCDSDPILYTGSQSPVVSVLVFTSCYHEGAARP